MNSTYQLTLSRNSVKFLAKQEKVVQKRIRTALIGLTERPPLGDIKPLKASDGKLRLRIGSFRVIFHVDLDSQMIYIMTISNRGDIY